MKNLVKLGENSPSAPIHFVEGRTGPVSDNQTGVWKGTEATMTLRRAVQIAAVALQDQTDEAGQPFILHALRFMDACSTEEERIVALLHEAVRHSRWTLGDLRFEGVPDDVVDAVHALTLAGAETRAASADHAPNR